MASIGRGTAGDGRPVGASPRPRGRENARDTLCRNVTIYGKCRYEDKGCAFNHDKTLSQVDPTKKRLNVDSPSFTPATVSSPNLSANGMATKVAGLSPKAANAAPFKPKGLASGNDFQNVGRKTPSQYNPSAPDWTMAPSTDVSEFIPSAQAMGQNLDPSAGMNQPMYDPYGSSTPIPAAAHGQHAAQMNPYLHDQTSNGAAPYYPPTNYSQPLNYHLYVPQAPYRENLTPNQRVARDFFISDTLREDLQRKSAATQQSMPNTGLPQAIDCFHSLVPLDTNNQKNAALFNHPTWVYKVTSAKDGKTYCLRRVEGFRLTPTNETALITVKQNWKKIVNANITALVDVFTNRSFGDGGGLMIVTDYFALSKTLAEAHMSSTQPGRNYRGPAIPVTEQLLWSYFVQIANALKTIHVAGLAARCLDPTKVLLIGKNRIRLGGCGILDVINSDDPRSISQLQQDDFHQMGSLLLTLGTNNKNAMHNPVPALEQFGRSYSNHLKERIAHLIGAGPEGSPPPRIDTLLAGLEGQVIAAFDAQEHMTDNLLGELNRELENSRIARLMIKLNYITERPEYGHDRQWSETGERYPIKLFRDYVFHRVDANGNPDLNLAWVISCLNQLDVGTDNYMRLTTRDEQTQVIVSFKEMKRLIESAFQDLKRMGRR